MIRCPKCGALNKDVLMYKVKSVIFRKKGYRSFVCPLCGYRILLEEASVERDEFQIW